MELPVSKELLDDLMKQYQQKNFDEYTIRVYFSGEEAEDEGIENRVNIEISGTVFMPGDVVSVWFG